jgi:hypothetical protein
MNVALQGAVSHIPSMAAPRLTDTSPDALQLLFSLYARMTPAEKLRQMQQLTQAVNLLALAGLRRRHPTEDEPALLLRLARIRLGDDLVDAVYGRTAARGP